MDFNLFAIISAVALVQFTAIMYLVRRFYKDTQVDYIALNSRMEKQTGVLAGLNGMFVNFQKHTVHFDEMMEKQQSNLTQLAKTVERHQQSLAKIDNKVAEFEKAGDLFKSLFDELPGSIEKYNAVMEKIKESAETELKKAKSNKDDELIKYQQQELDSIAVRKKLMEELPGLVSQFKEALNPVNERLKLFAGKDKYPTGTILSYPARRARSFLASIGEQQLTFPAEETPQPRSEETHDELISDSAVDQEVVAKVTRKRSRKNEQAA